MSESALHFFHILLMAEPILVVAALAAFLRVRRQMDLPSVRDYLVVRTLWSLPIFLILVFPVPDAGAAYFWIFWIGSFCLLFLELRVLMAALDRFLWAYSGLRALRSIGYRWFVLIALLLILPLILALGDAILYHVDDAGWWSLRLGAAIGLVESLAVGTVIVVGLRVGLSPRARLFGILLGLGLEPAADFIVSWFAHLGIWTWNNLARQVVTDCTLILWLIYLLLPDRDSPPSEPSETVLRWDQVARWVVRRPARTDPALGPAPDSAPQRPLPR